jgi:hypothetical protein
MLVCGQLHALAALFPGEEHRYTLCRRMGGPQIRPGCCREEKKSIDLAGNRTLTVQSLARRYAVCAVPYIILVLGGSECSALNSSHFTPSEIFSHTHWISSWMGCKACLDLVTKKIIPPYARNKPLASVYLVTILTELSCLSSNTYLTLFLLVNMVPLV